MHKAVITTLFLFSFISCGYAATPSTARTKPAYAFPKKVAPSQMELTEDDFDELTTFSDEDDFEEEFEDNFIVQTQPPQRPSPTKTTRKKNKVRGKYFRLDIAPQYSHMTLHSHDSKNQSGSLGGITGEAQYKKRDHVYGDASFLWEQGKIKADNRRSHTWKEAIAQGMIGYTVSITSHMSMTPYVGFGYRKVMDHQSTALPNERTSLNYYQYFVPFGFLTDYAFSKRLSLSLNLKAMPPVDSRLYIANMPGTFWKLKNKGCYEADLPFKWTAAITKYVDFDMTLNPFFKYWVLGPIPRLNLHSRTQVYWGVELQFGFSL